jgi:hypothetical protein
MASESFDGGVFIGQSRREFSSKPLCEFARKADRLRGPQTVAGEGLPDIYLVRLDAQPLRKLGYQPGLDVFCGPRIRL